MSGPIPPARSKARLFLSVVLFVYRNNDAVIFQTT